MEKQRFSSIIFIVFWIIISFIIGITISFSSSIQYPNYAGMIQNLSNICITICSISLATFLGVITLIITRKPETNTDKIPIDLAIIPIMGIIIALFSSYFSYFEESFIHAKFFLGIAMIPTIGSLIALYVIFTWKTDTFFE